MSGWETTVIRAPAELDRFEVCLAETLTHEGGVRQVPGEAFVRGKYAYANDPHDPGGETMLGVIQRVYDPWRDARGLPRRSVKLIDDHEIRSIYRENYWNLMRADELPLGVDKVAFDYAVNSGAGRATKDLQRLCGAKPDGAMGALTVAAIRRQDPRELAEELQETRRKFVRGLKHYWRFGKGWETRIDRVEASALKDLGREVAVMSFAAITAVADGGESTEPPAQYGGARATSDAPDSMAKSTTGNVAIFIGGSAILQIGFEAVTTIGRLTSNGEQPLSLAVLAFTLASSPTFVAAIGTVAGAAYTWLERRLKMQLEAV